MNTVFADSFYFFALLNRHEKPHEQAVAFARAFIGTLLTTGWILTEVADGLARPGHRELFLRMHQELHEQAGVVVVPCSDELYRRGIDFYGQRLDKEWSLTDCISFMVM